MVSPFHGSCIMEQALQQEETPFLVLGGIPAWVLSSHFVEIELTPQFQLATRFEQLVLLVNSLTHFPSIGKHPYWRITNSSILEVHSRNSNLRLTE